jgi:hypothetical protein
MGRQAIMEYVIAIPSYKRATLLKQKTLALLERFNVQKDKIHIFVANQKELEDYSDEIHGYNIIVAEKGLVLARRFYNRYFPKDMRILNLDDDCAELKQKTPDGKLEDFSASFDSLVETGFGICEKQGARLWGINPVANGFFMADTATVGLRYICGNVHGSYAGDSVMLGEDRSLESSGEDFLTTLRSFIKYGSVVRIDWVCPTTKYFANGGIDAELKDNGIMTRQIDHTARLTEIVGRYPDLATLVTKAGGVTNIRLKTITYSKLPRTYV